MFYTFGAGPTSFGPVNLRLDTAAQSIEALVFRPVHSAQGNLIYDLVGVDLKFTALNGVLNINSWPQTDLSLIYNHSDNSGINLWSVTARDTPFFQQNPIFDQSRSPSERTYTKNAFGNLLVGTISFVPHSSTGLSFALSVGYSRTNNYAALPKVGIGAGFATNSGQIVIKSPQAYRAGIFHDYNAFPLTLLMPFTPGAVPAFTNATAALSKGLDQFFSFFGAQQNTAYDLVFSPYVEYVPRDLGRPLNSVGCNFVLRSYGPLEPINAGKLNFPISIFVDRQNTFFGKPNVTVGAGLMFKWP